MQATRIPSTHVLDLTRRAIARWLPATLAAAILLGTVAVAPANSLVLWNRLGSDSEILNSAAGPNLAFYPGGDEFSVPAIPAYVPSVFGNALSIGPGSYNIFDRVHNVVFNHADQYLNSERGTIEAWYQQVNDPIPYQRGIYRIFDGGFGLGSGRESVDRPTRCGCM
jgi:hypothetical protein